MRELAAFYLETDEGAGSPPIMFESVEAVVGAWLAAKGTLDSSTSTLTLRDGRTATVTRSHLQTSPGRLSSVSLTEPTSGASFRTDIVVASHDGVLGVSIALSAATPAFAPTNIEVRRPRLVAELLRLPTTWRLRGSALPAERQQFKGAAGGDAFVSLVWSAERSVPVVAVSDEYGAVLHPGLAEDIASDLAGVAVVAELDVDASWRLTARKGREWSCFGGAVRIFWPFSAQNQSPFRHSLWTPQRLLADVADTETAAARIRDQLRRRVFAQAAFAMGEPAYFNAIRSAARVEELAALRSRAEGASDYRALADEYFEKANSLARDLEVRDETIRDLRTQLENARLSLLYTREEDEEFAPVASAPPSTVEEAVLEAMERFKNELTFGADVNEGILGIARDAGPPEKLLEYLSILADFTRARRAGSLGDSAVKWIVRKGATCSPESETIQNNATAVRERTWDDGTGASRYFDLHLKPADQTSPDRCVRIYFEYDEHTQKTVVGWIGRKPGL